MKPKFAVQQKTDLAEFNFEGFGVPISIRSNAPEVIEQLRETLPEIIPVELRSIKVTDAVEHSFEIKKNKSGKYLKIYQNGEEIFEHSSLSRLLEYLSSQIRITVAEFAKGKVFIHSGAVAWKNSGIIIPGQSHSGKTTLVSELIRLGAEYYSDEYAVLDVNSLLNPYPKMLSMRGIIDDFTQLDTSPDEFGAKIGTVRVPVRLILLSEYRKGSRFQMQELKKGEGMMEILKNAISIRHNPDLVLKVLKKTVDNALIYKCVRGDAKKTAPLILEFLESHSG